MFTFMYFIEKLFYEDMQIMRLMMNWGAKFNIADDE